MALKLKITAADYAKLSDSKKEEYLIQGDGSYSLDVEDLPDTSALSRALEHERTNHKTTKARQKEIDDELEELRTQSAIANKDVKSLTEQHTKKMGETTAEFNARLAKRDDFIKVTLIDSVASKLVNKISLAPALLLPHVKARMQVDFEGDTPVTNILDKDGKVSKMTIDELQQEFVANKEFSAIIKASDASGSAGAGKKNGGAGLKPSNNDVDLSKLSHAEMAARIESNKQA